MRSVLIFLGVVFLVVGALFYVLPTQWISGATTVTGVGGSDVRSATASVFIPWPITVAVFAIGSLLVLIGIALPDSERRDTYVEHNNNVRTREYVDVEPTTSRTVIKERVTHRH